MRTLLLVAMLVLNVGRASARPAEIEVGAQHAIAMYGDNEALTIDTSRGFGAHVEVFWSDSLSTRAAATFLNPAVYTSETDLGTMGLDLWSATARWHIGSRFSGYAGAGVALVTIGNLEDQFGDAVERQLDPELAAVVEGGVRYCIHPRIVLELGATYVPLQAEEIAVDPLIVSAGAAWRF
ncbi:MAG TPA: outer membrane beta-barrel protein [Thermoanaerobaculia bacterium]|nr:outer membrane beta-barrel protein [Thermoanaerobaculia bacterium]